MPSRPANLTIAALALAAAMSLSATAYLELRPWPAAERRHRSREQLRDELGAARGHTEATSDLKRGRLRLFTQGGPTDLDAYALFLRQRYGIELVVSSGCFPVLDEVAYHESYNQVVHGYLAAHFGSNWQWLFMDAFHRSQARLHPPDQCPTPCPLQERSPAAS